MAAGERRLWLRLLAPDDAADLVQEVRAAPARRYFGRSGREGTRSEVAGLWAYKEGHGRRQK